MATQLKFLGIVWYFLAYFYSSWRLDWVTSFACDTPWILCLPFDFRCPVGGGILFLNTVTTYIQLQHHQNQNQNFTGDMSNDPLFTRTFGKLFPSSHERRKLSHTTLCTFNRGNNRIWKGIRIWLFEGRMRLCKRQFLQRGLKKQ